MSGVQGVAPSNHEIKELAKMKKELGFEEVMRWNAKLQEHHQRIDRNPEALMAIFAMFDKDVSCHHNIYLLLTENRVSISGPNQKHLEQLRGSPVPSRDRLYSEVVCF